MSDVETIENDAIARFSAATSVDELRAAHTEVLGKRSPLNAIRQTLGQLDPDERKIRGQELNDARARIEAAYAEREAALLAAQRADQLAGERLDLTETRSTGGR